MILLALAVAAVGPDCTTAADQPSINACALGEYRNADAALNRGWSAALDAARKAGGEDRAEKLLAAQRAWLKFRDAHCDALHPYTMGAQLDYTLNVHCRTDLTQHRSKDLADFAKSLNQ